MIQLAQFNRTNYNPDGYQVMKYTYDTFTQLRSSIDMPKECVASSFLSCVSRFGDNVCLSTSIRAEPFLEPRYPPHGPEAIKALTGAVHLLIPQSTPDGR